MKRKGFLIAFFLTATVAVCGFMPWLPTLFFKGIRGIDFRLGKQLLAEWSVLVFIALFFFKSKWIKFLFIWLVIRTALTYNKSAYVTVNTIFIYLVFFQVYVDKLKQEYFPRILDCICAVAMFNVLWMVWQMMGFWVIIIPKNGMVIKDVICNGLFPKILTSDSSRSITGLMSNVNMTASLLVLTLPAFFRKEWRVCLPLVYICIFATGCMGGIIPAAVITIFFLWHGNRKWRWNKKAAIALTGVCLIISVIFFQDKIMSSERWEVWHMSMTKLFTIHPYLGFGVGQFKQLFPVVHRLLNGAYSSQKFLQAHNDWIQALIEFGSIGMFFIVGYFTTLFYKVRKSKDYLLYIAFVGVVVGMMNSGVNFLCHTTTGVLVLIYMGMLQKVGMLQSSLNGGLKNEKVS